MPNHDKPAGERSKLQHLSDKLEGDFNPGAVDDQQKRLAELINQNTEPTLKELDEIARLFGQFE